MQTYRTRAGDTVDWIAFQQYESADAAYIAMILEANPGLADYGPILPAAVAVSLPAAALAATTDAVGDAVTLWS